jgi:hypothetical protein
LTFGKSIGVWGVLIDISVMAGLVPAIHVLAQNKKDVDARHKARSDEETI